MPLILGSQSAVSSEAYSIDNSCRFNRADSAKLAITFGSAGDLRKWTLSFWLKRGNITQTQRIMVAGDGSNNNLFGYVANDTLDYLCYTTRTPANQGNLLTNRLFRDPSAWYHYVFVWDTDNATADLRLRMYINGTEETSFSADVNEENADSIWNSAVEHQIAKGWDDQYFDGYIAEAVFTDGQVYAPSDFGEFNSDSPTIWQPKDPSGLTMSGNSFWLDFEDSSDLGNDVSGNNNDFTSTNLAAIDQCLDSPTNNFATLNLLQNYYDPGVFTQGNCTYTTAGGTGMYSFRTTTLGMSKSKWYMEFRKTTGDTNAQWGYASEYPTANNNYCGEVAGNYGLYGANGFLYTNASAVSSGWGTMSTGYVMLAIDLDNNFIYFGKDGTWLKSGDPTSGATGTGGQSITAASASTIGHYFFAVGDFSNTSGYDFQCNFGNGSFGETAAGATNADDNDQGIFKYDVPTGYYALCTKNLAEFG